jgi:hypothetical protein
MNIIQNGFPLLSEVDIASDLTNVENIGLKGGAGFYHDSLKARFRGRVLNEI